MRAMRPIALIVAALTASLVGCSISSGGPAFSSASVNGAVTGRFFSAALGTQGEAMDLAVGNGPTAATIAFGPASAPTQLSGIAAAGQTSAQDIGLPALGVAGAATLFALSATTTGSTTLGSPTVAALTITLAYTPATLPAGAAYTVYARESGAYVAVGTGALTSSADGQALLLTVPTFAFAAGASTGLVVAEK